MKGFIKEEWQIPFFDRFVETRSQSRGDKTGFYVKSRNEGSWYLVLRRTEKLN